MRRGATRRWTRPLLEPLEPRWVPDTTLSAAGVLPQPGVTQWHTLEVAQSGVLSAEAVGTSGLRLTLARADATVLATSEDLFAGRLDLHLAAGSYRLGVSADGPDVAYQLSAHVTEASSPLDPLATGAEPHAVAVGDLNGDGRPDLVSADRNADALSLFLGNGDGTFGPRQVIPVGDRPVAVLIADVIGDGHPDLIVANSRDDTLSVLAGNGDGTFAARPDLSTGSSPVAVAAGDLDGDGQIDLVSANADDDTVSVLFATGNGSFTRRNFPAGFEPSAVAVADVNGDGRPEVIAASFQDQTVSVLPNLGEGTFAPRVRLTVGHGPTALAVADVNGDGRSDVIVANRVSNSLSVLLGASNGLYAFTSVAAGTSPVGVAVADLNADGRPDLIAANAEDAVTVLLGAGDGTFPTRRELAAGSDVTAVAAADLDGDARPDLVTANGRRARLNVLGGNGDGTFRTPGAVSVGREPDFVALADLDGDGVLDALSADAVSGTVSVRRGNGDGTFQRRVAFATGRGPVSVVTGDFNGDGRPDAATANLLDGTVSILLGNGDGTLFLLGTHAIGDLPQTLAVADVDRDGVLDLVSADSGSDTLTVLKGQGDGTFRLLAKAATGSAPYGVTVTDVDRDGWADLIAANRLSGSLSVILGHGDRFDEAIDLKVGDAPVSVTAADVDRDGWIDLVSANLTRSLSVYRGGPDGFHRAADLEAGGGAFGVIAADLDGDGRLDLASADVEDATLSILLANADGTFRSRFTVPVGEGPIALVAGDLNADGRPDLVSSNSRDATLGVVLGPFLDASTPRANTTLRAAPPPFDPVLADLDGDGLVDAVTRDRAGQLLFRRGQADASEPFGPARLLNDPLLIGPGHAARDVVALRTGSGWALAAIESGPPHRVVLYTLDLTGRVSHQPIYFTSVLPARLAVGDLDGSGRDALVLVNALEDSVTILLPGRFDRPITRPVGSAPSDIMLTEFNGDGRLDVVVSAAVSGDVTVLTNDAEHLFTDSARFAAGLGLSAVSASGVVSLRQPVALAAGDFVTGSGADVAVVSRGSHELRVLRNNGRGGLVNPDETGTTSTTRGQTFSDAPGPIVTGDFDRDGRADVAMLERGLGEVWVYLGRGDGTFRFAGAVTAGADPAGLAVQGRDLLVANPAGDLLRLVGNGDGTFAPPPPVAGRHTSVAAQGRAVVVVNQRTGVASVQAVTADGTARTLATLPPPDAASQQAPRDGVWAALNGGAARDLIVVGEGSNDVLVYRNLGADDRGVPVFAVPDRYAVGTRPVAVVTADLNADGVLDLVVTNRGSNDVSILFGGLASGRWTASPGPRVRSGGTAPVASTVRDLDGRRELVVTNGGGSVVVLKDRGFGFFDDSAPRVVPVPTPIGPMIPGPRGPMLPTENGIVGLHPVTLQPTGMLFGRVQAADAVGDGRLVVVRTSGEVALLSRGSDGLFEVDVEMVPQNGIPSEPTALAVLEGDSGLRVLVTTAGSDALFVFDLPASEPVGLPEPPQDSPVASTATELGSQSLVVVVTLLATGLPDEAGGAGAQVAGGNLAPAEDDAFAVGGEGEAVPAEEAVVPAGTDSSGSADAEKELGRVQLYLPADEPAQAPKRSKEPVAAEPPAETNSSGSADAERELEQLRLYRPTDEPAPAGVPVGRLDAPPPPPVSVLDDVASSGREGWALALLVCVPPLLVASSREPSARGTRA